MTPSDDESALQAITTFTGILNDLKISYLIGGSFASSAYGDFRTTNDIDFLAEVREEHLDLLFDKLTPEFIFDSIAIREAVHRRRTFNIIHDATFFKIDVFTRIEWYQHEELKRAQDYTLHETNIVVKIASPEDIILSKLHWFKLGHEVSTQQWRDILGVFRVQKGRLDLAYLTAQALKLDVAPLLEKAIQESTAQ